MSIEFRRNKRSLLERKIELRGELQELKDSEEETPKRIKGTKESSVRPGETHTRFPESDTQKNRGGQPFYFFRLEEIHKTISIFSPCGFCSHCHYLILSSAIECFLVFPLLSLYNSQENRCVGVPSLQLYLSGNQVCG